MYMGGLTIIPPSGAFLDIANTLNTGIAQFMPQEWQTAVLKKELKKAFLLI